MYEDVRKQLDLEKKLRKVGWVICIVTKGIPNGFPYRIA